ncbi:conserved Plasmodium protein, unknown function [Plasmodium yoelii]|uniref:C2H2-type domain-containing protein n=2 Tax=Plasmodium yoelii TaxID=5861 RepID=A0AAE9WRN0_PLAYO|nr:conserved Plasmodium protein, unknown function [Plasmodium yoelii]WBY57801.1 hypothetical protein Py17XNL_001002123 [Plasmodium yoelii yoelii]CDU84906.1 conserved Plasmodium protein, unknown function [Plasmodium yoelii]VTZ78802.1 conserved Plasmodium protein, unknown function [Plasmodium yoelii]|eukprot:XP_731398.2 conserved Plasmodium protein, unknown function [Plasmodium yoelii]
MNIDLTDSGYYQNNASSDNVENKKNNNCIELVKEKIFVYKCNICLLVFTCVHIFERHIIKENHRVKQLDVLKKDKYFNCLRCKYICLSIVKIIKHIELYNHGQNILKKIKKKILYTGKAICECKIKCYSIYSQSQVNLENKESIKNKKENYLKVGINDQVNIKRGNKTNKEIEKNRNDSYIYNKFESNNPFIRYIDQKEYHKNSENNTQIYDNLSFFFQKNNATNNPKIRDDIYTKFLNKDTPMHSFPPFCKNLSQKHDTINSRNFKNNAMNRIIYDEVRRISSDPYCINNKNYNIFDEKIIAKGNIITRTTSSSSSNSEDTTDEENNFNNNWPDLQKPENQQNKKYIYKNSNDINHNLLLDIYSNNFNFSETKNVKDFSLNSFNEKKESEIYDIFENNNIPFRGEPNIIYDDNAKITKDKFDNFRHKKNADNYQWGMFNWDLYRSLEKTNFNEPQKIEKTNERNISDNKNYNNRHYIPFNFKRGEKENKVYRNISPPKSTNEKKLLSIFIPDLVSNILGKNDEEKQNETNSYFSNIPKNVTDYDILNTQHLKNKKVSFTKLSDTNNSDVHTQNNDYKIKSKNDNIYNEKNEKMNENITSQTNKIRKHLSENYIFHENYNKKNNEHENNHTIFPNLNNEQFSKIQYCDMVLTDNDNINNKSIVRNNDDDDENNKYGNTFICNKINKIYDNLSCYETFQNELPLNMDYINENLNSFPQSNQAIETEKHKHINIRNKQKIKDDIVIDETNCTFYKRNDNNPNFMDNMRTKNNELLNIFHNLNLKKINDTEYSLKNKTQRFSTSNMDDFAFLDCTNKDDQNKINNNTFWEFINYYNNNNNNTQDGQDNKRNINFIEKTEDDSWDTFTNNRNDNSEFSYNDDTIPDWIAKEVNSNNSDITFDEQYQWKQQINCNNIYAKDEKQCTHIFNPKNGEEILWDSIDKQINHHIDYGNWNSSNEKDKFGMKNKKG